MNSMSGRQKVMKTTVVTIDSPRLWIVHASSIQTWQDGGKSIPDFCAWQTEPGGVKPLLDSHSCFAIVLLMGKEIAY